MLYWHWIVLAGVFFIIEMLTFTMFFLCFGVSALIMSLIVLLLPASGLHFQIILASFLSLASMVLGYYFFSKKKKLSYENINDRMSMHIGKNFTITNDCIDGVGKIKIGDTYWRVLVDNCSKGDTVKITSFKSTSFIATKFEDYY